MTVNDIKEQFREIYLNNYPETDKDVMYDIVERIGLEGICCNPNCESFGECDFRDCNEEVAYKLVQMFDDIQRIKNSIEKRKVYLEKAQEFICELLSERAYVQHEIVAWAFNYLSVYLDELNLFSLDDAIDALPDKTFRDTARNLISDCEKEVDKAQTIVINQGRLYSTNEWPHVEQWQVFMYIVASLCDEPQKCSQAVEWMEYAKSVNKRMEYYFS